jgi:hypothetical protein
LAPTICACAVSAPAKVTRAKIRYNFVANVTVAPEVFLVVDGLVFQVLGKIALRISSEVNSRRAGFGKGK